LADIVARDEVSITDMKGFATNPMARYVPLCGITHSAIDSGESPNFEKLRRIELFSPPTP